MAKRLWGLSLFLALLVGALLGSTALVTKGQSTKPWRVWQRDSPCSGRSDWVVVSQDNPGAAGGSSYYEVFPGSLSYSTRLEAEAEAELDRQSPRFQNYCCHDYSVYQNQQTNNFSVVQGKFGDPGSGWFLKKGGLCCDDAFAYAGMPALACGSLNLSGIWTATGYNCGGGTLPPEDVRIDQTGQSIVATKITGDACVGSGELTWRGNFTGSTFQGQLQGGDHTAKSFQNVQVEVKSPELLTVSGTGWTITYKKIAGDSARFDGGTPGGSQWAEVESGWRSVWTRRPGTKIFDATYTGPKGEHAATVSTVSVIADRVFINRTSSSDNNLCSYLGQIGTDGVIKGTYTCPRGGTKPWTARIIN